METSAPLARARRIAALTAAALCAAALPAARAAGIDDAIARVDVARAVAIPDVPGALRITGELNAEVWRTAQAIDAFVQREPEDGGTPSERTEFRVAYSA